MGPGAVLKGIVQRLMPPPFTDDRDLERPVRFGRYGEQRVENMIPRLHLLADEGSYFTVNNGQTGIANAAAPTSFSATNPFITIFNGDDAGASNTKRIYLDYCRLLATAAGTAGASVQAAIVIDNTNRFTSGGTPLTSSIVSPNMDIASAKSVAVVNAGNITAAAAGLQARTVVGNIYLKGAIPVAGDQYNICFGGVDCPSFIGISTILTSMVNVPPVVLGPGDMALIYIWLPSQSAASSYAPELSWWER